MANILTPREQLEQIMREKETYIPASRELEAAIREIVDKYHLNVDSTMNLLASVTALYLCDVHRKRGTEAPWEDGFEIRLEFFFEQVHGFYNTVVSPDTNNSDKYK